MAARDRAANRSITAAVMHTRLVRPALHPGAVPRPRLVRPALARLRPGRIVSIEAGAGYGKTVLAAQIVATARRRSAWVSLDPRIDSAALLVAHVGAALARLAPGLGAGLPYSEEPDVLVTALVNEIAQTLPDDVILALDDTHLLPPPAAGALGRLALDLPPGVALLLTGRDAPPFPTARLRLGGMAELGEADLELTPDETAELLVRAGIDDRAADELHRLTEGWAAGAVLAARRPAGAAPPCAAPQDALFAYLAEEVLDGLPADRVGFLETTSVLDRMDAGIARAVSGDEDAAGCLRRLASGHLFTTDQGGGWYRYHGLLRSVLRTRLASRPPGEVADIHRRAAAAWRAAGEDAEAVDHLIAAGDHDEAVRVAEPLAGALVAGGGAPMLMRWLDAIPSPRWSGRPALVAARAMAELGADNHAEAFAALERAADAAVAAGEGAGEILLQLLPVLESGGRFARGIAIARRLLGAVPEDGAEMPLLLVRLAAFHGYLGEHRRAEELLARSVRLPAAASIPALGTYVAVIRAWTIERGRGELDEALGRLVRAEDWLRANREHDVLALGPWVHVFRVTVMHDLGRLRDGDRELDRMLVDGVRSGHGAMAEAVVARWRLTLMADRGDWGGVADEMARRETRLLAARAVSWNHRAFLLAARADVALGRPDDALRHLDIFEGALREGAPIAERVRLLPDAVRVALGAGDVTRARALAADALADADRSGSDWGRARALIAAALAWEGDPRADRLLARALDPGCRVAGGQPWTGLDRPDAARLLGRALARGLGPPGEAERLLAACGGDVVRAAAAELAGAGPAARARLATAASLPDVEITVLEELLRDPSQEVRAAARGGWQRRRMRPRADIAIRSLGGLEVLRDGRRLPAGAFARAKARLLLAALLAAGGSLHREQLADRLWPDLPAARGAAALRTTLHDLRRAVEPETDPSSPDALVVSDGDIVRLVMAPADRWDVADMLAHVDAARRAPADERLERLERADALYRGPFLPDQLYDEWAITRRDELDMVHRGVLTGLADLLVAAGRPAEAARRLARLAVAEPLDERVHRRLMRAYAAAGEVALALRQYHVCRAALQREFELSPGDETRALYRELLAGSGRRRRPPADAGGAPARVAVRSGGPA
ncbi:MAG: BTAD domain-containing putative transcriptional regulator [Thermoleophilia bacterium]